MTLSVSLPPRRAAAAFGGPGGKVLVAPEARSLRWSADGTQIFYLNDGALMVVDVRTEPGLTAGTPRVVSEGPFEGVDFGIHPDTGRLLMIQPTGLDEGQAHINVVLNWVEELKRLVPAR